MGQVIDAIYAGLLAVLIATGSFRAMKKIGHEVRVAALTKATQGLPPLSPFTEKLTGIRKKE